MLRKWLMKPLVDVGAILARQCAVSELSACDDTKDLKLAMRAIGDAEKHLLKIHYGRIKPSSLYSFVCRWRDIALLLQNRMVNFESRLLSAAVHEVLLTQDAVSEFIASISRNAANSNKKPKVFADDELAELFKVL